jgi:hypothetical protein
MGAGKKERINAVIEIMIETPEAVKVLLALAV